MFLGLEVYKRQALRALPIIGSYASMLGVALTLMTARDEFPWWAIFLIVLGFLLMILNIILELKSRSNTRVYRITDRQRIRNYMYDWINGGGRVAMWTRDMSWVDDDEMRQPHKILR